MPDAPKPVATEQPLESWKAIAAYLNRDARTVMRWEKAEGLPVHRHHHLTRSSVYAYPSELDAWRAARRPDQAEAKPGRRLVSRGFALVATVAVALLPAGDARFSGLAAQDAVSDRLIDWPEGASMAASAAISPDGRYVSYIDMTTRELHVRELRSGRAWQVTQIHAAGGFVDESAISNNGRFIAFASEEKDEERSGLRILPLASSPGEFPRLLLEGIWIAPRQWSADDRHILVTADRENLRTDIGLVDVADGTMRVLATMELPEAPSDRVVLSPDGRFVAYDTQAEPNLRQRDVYILPVTGGPAVALLTGPPSDEVVGWSPGGRSLVIRSDRPGSRGIGLWTLPVTDGRPAGEPTLVRADFRGDILNMTAGGKVFYEHTLRTDQLLATRVDVETGARLGAPELIAHDREAFSRRPRWSPDGQALMYETRRPTGSVIAIRTIATNVVREIPLNLAYVWTFDWSPDGKWIVCRATDFQARRGIYLVNVASGDVELLVPWVETADYIGYFVPQFWPDNENITYITGRRDRTRAWYHRRNIRTGEETLIAEVVIPPSWQQADGAALRRSPDGNVLVMVRGDSRSSVLVALHLESARFEEVFRADRANAFNPEDGVQWLADSRSFVANVRGEPENKRELWWVPVDGRQPHRIDIGVDNLVDSAVAVHPDGKHVAFVAGHPVPSKTAVLDTEFRLLQIGLQSDR